MFDPSAPLPDFASQRSNLERQKRLAEVLRKQFLSESPQGQMVSGRYVAPSWAEQLVPLANAAGSAYMDYQSRKSEKDYNTGVDEARQNWQSSLPRATEAVPGRPELTGPRDEAGSPELDPVQAIAAKLPSRDSILSATLAGMRIPGNEKAAELYNKGMSDEITREDAQQERKDNLTATLLQRTEEHAKTILQRTEEHAKTLEQRNYEAKLRSEDTRLSIEQRRDAAKEAAATKREHEQTLLAIASMKGDGEKPLKPLPAAQAKAWTENNKSIKFIDDAVAALDAYPKAFGSKNALGNTVQSRLDPKGVEARALAGNIGSLKVHDRSGAAVTAAEIPRLQPFIPVVNGPFADNAATIRKKMQLFQREYRLMQNEIVDLAETQGYKSPVKKTDTGETNSGAEVTKTINGKTYVQRNGQWFER